MSWLLSILLQWILGYMCPFQLWFPQSICPVVGLLGHLIVLFSSFSIMTVSGYIPTNSARRFPFPFSLWRLSSEELMLLNCGVGEDSWESRGLKEIQPLNPKGTQPWIFTGRTDAEAETPILWPPEAKSQLNGKHPDARKDWRQEEKGVIEYEMVGWYHQLNGHEFE